MTISKQLPASNGIKVKHGVVAPMVVNDDEPWDVRQHLDVVLNSITDHAVLTLDRNGRITSWNSGAERTKGYKAADIIGRHFSCFYTPEDQRDAVPARVLALAVEHGQHSAEGWRVRADGERFWASVMVQPMRDADGTVRGFVKVTRDIGQKLQVEKLRDELTQSQKQEMVGQLTGGVAHDFNNLLTAIDASYQLVRGYSSDERISRVLEINKVGIDRSRKLITQLLAFSKKQVLRPKASNMHELVSVFDVLIEKAVGESIRLRWNLQAECPPVMIDQAQFQSVLLNLIVNARDAMAGSGWISVFMEQMTLQAPNLPPPFDVPAGEYVALGVSDTGSGMTPEVVKRAIEPFFTTKPVGRGTGLGLSQCYGFARQSGGTLKIDSTEGRGTTVRIILPALVGEGVQPADNGHRTVLLVEDDTGVRTLVAEMLRVLGHTVIEAEDARDALDMLHKDVAIDYLFTDIIMPNDMNGLQLVAAARAIRPELRALLASGYPREVLRDIGTIPNDVGFVAKPYSLSDLTAHIGRMRAA